jgi:hypothetical protein
MLTRYLVGGPAPAPVVDAYVAGHARIPFATSPEPVRPDVLDRALVRRAGHSPLQARAADSYARFARPGGPLRQKLALLLAILESTPPYHQSLNAGAGGGPVRAAGGLAGAGIAFLGSLALGALLFAPVHVRARLAVDRDESAPRG